MKPSDSRQKGLGLNQTASWVYRRISTGLGTRFGGAAHVGRDQETLVLTENESVYLPVGCVHWLENRGKIPLELIEVQTGSYLGEDDIVRFEDQYGRAGSREDAK
jgi:hypothetical protein